jgi:hypothetical protein
MITGLFRKIRSLRDEDEKPSIICRRLSGNPIIHPQMLRGNDGANINGPSLIRVPDWLPNPLGRYYLYFAHHRGAYIRLAYADALEGPWHVYDAGSLALADAPACRDHIASPDVLVDNEARRIRMYFHGVAADRAQKSFVALSEDGIGSKALAEPLGTFYFRVVPWRGTWIAMAKGGVTYRSKDGLSSFERTPYPAFALRHPDGNAPGDVRHVALHCVGDTLQVYFSRIGDAPERILRSRIDLTRDWIADKPEMVLRPETIWEGTDVRLRKSRSGAATGRENALRDPAIFEEGGRLYLLYSIAGESGIAIAELLERQ